MLAIRVLIVHYADAHQPGWVECRLTDAWGEEITFVEKVPVVTADPLDELSDYPQPGVIACEVVRRWLDGRGREVVTVDTERPWGVESTGGKTRFDVLPGQLVEC